MEETRMEKRAKRKPRTRKARKKKVVTRKPMSKLVDKIETHWNETWKKIKTKRETNKVDYFISDYGRIKSVVKEDGMERLLKPAKMPKGYMTVNATVVGPKREVYHIHRLVYDLFMEKNEKEGEKYFVVHKDGNKENNHVRNLEVLNREQLNTRWDNEGFFKDTAKKKHVKLTETKVIALKRMLKKGKTKKKILAKKFNISLTQLKRIESGENWGQVEA